MTLLSSRHPTAIAPLPAQTVPVANRSELIAVPSKDGTRALRESLPNPTTLVVLEPQQHNAMDGGREVLVDAIIKFAATKE
jgi:hypothetical protein